MEPSGKMYNDFRLNKDNKPHNACINTGATVLCALFYPEAGSSEKFKNCLNRFSELAGSELGFDQEAYLQAASEPEAYRALAYYMASSGALPSQNSIEDCVDFYFQSKQNCK